MRRFVDARVYRPSASTSSAAPSPPRSSPRSPSSGSFRCNLQGYGCASISETAYGIAMQELEQGDSGIRSFASVQGSLVMYPIHSYGSEAQKERWLPKMAKGEIIGCFGLTEPDAGSNPAGMRTVAIDDGTHWVLNGTKRWITNGNLAQVALVWAKVGGLDGQVRGFLVPTDTKGFEAQQAHSQEDEPRASVAGRLIMEDVRIPQGRRAPQRRRHEGAALVPHLGASSASPGASSAP
ncbi:MAG: acyl-CoA dehydrogenase family protein [Polyangiaceae bacterium]